MQTNSFDTLADLLRKAKASEPTADELQLKVKAVFKRSLEAIKIGGYRPSLTVGKSFLETYYRENGRRKFLEMISKLSLLTDNEGKEYLVKLGVIKKKV